jgi:hypothetical protein
MPSLAVESIRVEDVTFIEAFVTADRPHRIRIERCFEGPIFPPRSNGDPVAGWDERGVTRNIEPGTTPFGFATPVVPEEPAVELVEVEPLVVGDVPEPFSSWLHRIEQRIDRAERLTGVDDLPSATAAVASAGGLEAIEQLEAELAADERALSRLSFGSEELRNRIESVDIPTAAFARLAASVD